jgi:hypothetical protein
MESDFWPSWISACLIGGIFEMNSIACPSLMGNGIRAMIVDQVYDSRGSVSLFVLNDGSFVDLRGRFIGFCVNEVLYDFNGNHRGWYCRGLMRDLNGNVVGFNSNIQDSSHPVLPVKRLVPVRPVISIKPVYPVRSVPFVRPVSSLGWAAVSPEQLFRR